MNFYVKTLSVRDDIKSMQQGKEPDNDLVGTS